MGTIKIVAAAVLLIGASAVAHAQSGAENAGQQPPRPTAPPVPAQEPGWLGDSLPPLWNRVYVNINAARQPQTWTFDSLNTFSSFGEEGTLETIQNVGIGTLLDASAGYHLARHFAVGGGFWTAVSKSAVAGTAAMPDPLVYGQYAVRTLDASGLYQKTFALNLQAILTASLGKRLNVAFFIGPTVARVKLDVGSLTFAPASTSTSSSTSSSQTSTTTPPAAAQTVQTPRIDVTSQAATTAKAATAGFDITFMLTERYGIGVLARHVRGKVNLPIAPNMEVGGNQVGAGLRYRF
jgi:hypothetical protein